jgi:hypothetical protein
MCWNTLYYTRVEKCARRESGSDAVTLERRKRFFKQSQKKNIGKITVKKYLKK